MDGFLGTILGIQMARYARTLIVVGVAALILVVITIRSVRQIDQMRFELNSIDQEIVDLEQRVLAEALSILADDSQFRNSINEQAQFKGSVIERQKKFVLISGNIISQLIGQEIDKEKVSSLQNHLNKRSILVSRFDDKAREIELSCSTGVSSYLATIGGGCSESLN